MYSRIYLPNPNLVLISTKKEQREKIFNWKSLYIEQIFRLMAESLKLLCYVSIQIIHDATWILVEKAAASTNISEACASPPLWLCTNICRYKNDGEWFPNHSELSTSAKILMSLCMKGQFDWGVYTNLCDLSILTPVLWLKRGKIRKTNAVLQQDWLTRFKFYNSRELKKGKMKNWNIKILS